jgi:branched-subunit amino acid transport protein AzlD
VEEVDVKYIIAAILLSAVITFFLRALPFLIFNGKNSLPDKVSALGRVLPSAIMAVLIVYCFKGVIKEPVSEGIPAVIASAVVVFTYKWKHNTLASIFAGTVCYMLLLGLIG